MRVDSDIQPFRFFIFLNRIKDKRKLKTTWIKTTQALVKIMQEQLTIPGSNPNAKNVKLIAPRNENAEAKAESKDKIK